MDDLTRQTTVGDGSANPRALKRILYVEDSATSQWVLKQKLGNTAEITITDSLAGARDALKARRFDLVIADWSLPDGKGTDLLPAIRSQYSTQQLPVIVVSASMERTMMTQALHLGANDCHPKPISWTKFSADVERMLLAPYVSPLIKAGPVVTWVEGFSNGQFWLYCPEADFFLKGSDADVVRQNTSRHLRTLAATNFEFISACTVNVSLHFVNSVPPPESPSSTGP